ncbi:MAG: AraC family transcriptional regulator [Actinomycetota bacterium]
MSPADPLSDVLRVLRVGGSLVLHERYAAPWAVEVPGAARLADLTRAAPDQVVAFHLVREGWLHLVDDRGATVRAGAGDLLVSFGGAPHQLRCGAGARPQPLERLMGMDGEPPCPTDAAGDGTTLVCGVFSIGTLGTSPLADGLPPTVHVPCGAGEDFDALAGLLAAEVDARRPGWEFAVTRLLELLCAEALREVARTAPTDDPSWLRALADPPVLAAMAAVHGDPAREWDVAALGRVAALSPSRLTARFRTTLGQSPMGYVTLWRMIVASELLIETDLPVQLVAERVGYTAQPSFTRAFTRHHGVSPREHRTVARSARHH